MQAARSIVALARMPDRLLLPDPAPLRNLKMRLSRLISAAYRVALSKFYLRSCTRVGARPRVWGRPHIQNRGQINIGNRLMLVCRIVPASLVTRPGAVLDIGSRVYINFGANICAYERITIKDRVIIGTYVSMVDNDEHELHDHSLVPPSRPITIEEDAWLGDRVMVLKGVTIGKGAVIGAGSVVTRDVAPYTIAAGVPARAIRTYDPARAPAAGRSVTTGSGS